MRLVVAYIQCKNLVDTGQRTCRRVRKGIYTKIQEVAAVNRNAALGCSILLVSIVRQVPLLRLGCYRYIYLRIIERDYLLLLELDISEQGNVRPAVFSYKCSSKSRKLASICLSAICQQTECITGILNPKLRPGLNILVRIVSNKYSGILFNLYVVLAVAED